MKKLALLLLVLPLAACGYDTFQKPGATESQFAWDQTICQNYAIEQPPAVILSGSRTEDKDTNVAKEQKDFRSCMVGKGYSFEHTMGLRRIPSRS
jgi:hypothetical protein